MSATTLPLLIDLQAVQSIAHGERGIARYATSQTRSLLKTPGAVRSIFLNPAMPFPKHVEPNLTQPPLFQWNTSRNVRRALEAGPAALYITSPMEMRPHYPECIISPHTVGAGMPLVVTLYDLIPLEMPELYFTHPTFTRDYRERLRLFGFADLVLAISEHTREVGIRLLELDPDRVVNIGGGADDFFREPSRDSAADRAAARRLGITRPFIVSVLGQDPRKNLDGLVDAFAALPRKLRREHQLVIVGKYDAQALADNRYYVNTRSLADDDVVFTHRISDEDLRSLYYEARLCVFPSFTEGFGLPVAEAIACGCPAITSNTSALPEILGWEPATFDPRDSASMARKIEQALTNESFRMELLDVARTRSTVHTWDAVAKRTLAAVERASPRMRRTPRRNPRIALVGPLPPQQTGVATYNARMTAELARRCDLQVFTGKAQLSPRAGWRDHARVFDQMEIDRSISPHAFDALLYTVGNGSHYSTVLDLALAHRGICWFHDVRLYALYLNYALRKTRGTRGETAAIMRVKLGQLYGDRHAAATDEDLLDPLWYQSHDEIGLTGELTAASEMVIVHSEHALNRLKKDHVGAAFPRALVVPLAIPELARPARPRPPATRPLLASFGIAHPVKATDLLVDAVALLRDTFPTDLALVGPIDDAYRKELEERAGAQGVADRVTITGRVPDEEYIDWLHRADCAAQLRRIDHGESSASINDCLAAGVPVLTNSPTYRDAKAEFVRALPNDVTADQLARVVRELFANTRQFDDLRAAGKVYAEACTFPRVADRILASIAELWR